MSPKGLLIFDLDGTLLDTAPDLVATLNHILSRYGLKEISINHAQPMIGQGARAMIQKAYDAQGYHLEPTELDQHFDRFIEYYTQHIADYTRPFPGLIKALTILQEDGWEFAVCTSKLVHLAEKLLKKLALNHLFIVITGGNSLAQQKPHPEPLKKTIELAGGQMTRSIMIGDSRSDIEAAKAARIPVIAVDFGYTPVPVAELNPDYIISHFDELHKAVSAISKQHFKT